MVNAEPDIASVAAILGDPGRASIVTALMDGRALPAGELARIAGVTAQTASAHLGRLVAAGLLAVNRTGRHRYYRIADARVARVVEALGAIAPPARVRSLTQSLRIRRLARARTCYDHLAGQLAVELAEALITRSNLGQYVLSPKGAELCVMLGVDRALAVAGSSVRICNDWTERRPHVAGKVGRALLEGLIAREAVLRTEIPRELRVTPEGELLFGRMRDSLRTVSKFPEAILAP